MGSTAKALKLLDYFSASRPTIGLTQFAKLAGYDKATTHRRLSELCAVGFVEQDSTTRAYRMGPAILRLANVRESTYPTRESALPVLQALSEATGETVHLSLIEGDTGLATVAHLMSHQHGMRAHIDEAEILPFHATASGLVCLAFSSVEFRQHILSQRLQASTEHTMTDRALLEKRIEEVANSGFGRSDGGFESEVTGLSAPVFDAQGFCNGAVAVASPSSRVDAASQIKTQALLQTAATAITVAWGGEIPDHLKNIWSQTNH